jgi:hypothetical protein
MVSMAMLNYWRVQGSSLLQVSMLFLVWCWFTLTGGRFWILRADGRGKTMFVATEIKPLRRQKM